MSGTVEEKAKRKLAALQKYRQEIVENNWLTAKDRAANADNYNRCRYQIEILEEILKKSC